MSEVVATVAWDVRPGLSGAEAALYGAIIAGTFTLLGVVVERLIRVLGRLQFEAASEPSLVIEESDESPREKGYPRTIPLKDIDATEEIEAQGVAYDFAVDLFNGKEVPIGLRDISVDIVLDDDKRITSKPYDPATFSETLARQRGYDKLPLLAVLNLPPRQLIHMVLSGSFGEEAASVLISGKWRRIEFVGKFPKRPFFGILGSKTYRKTITEP
jgi:hypothetical protein